MKAAHITINYNPWNASGIINTLNSKKSALKNIGADFYDFIFINDFKSNIDNDIRFVKTQNGNLIKSYTNKFFNKFKMIEELINLNNYDKIILRYPLADKSGFDLFNKNKVIIEDHSLRFSDLNSSLNLSEIKYPVIFGSSVIKKITENKYGLELRNLSSGIIGVTNEINNQNIKELSKNIPKIVIPNGIDNNKIKQTGFEKFDGKELKMILVASRYSPWHGIERLISSMDNFCGKVKLSLNLVGDFNKNQFKLKNHRDEIIYNGIKNEIELDELYKMMNFGIGTLGLFQKGMNEACPLKVREYCSRGIPFIKAYQDTDIDRFDDFKNFYLNFPNDNSLIDFGQVIDFVSALTKNNKSISQGMHEASVKYLDWRVKMIEYHQFVESI